MLLVILEVAIVPIDGLDARVLLMACLDRSMKYISVSLRGTAVYGFCGLSRWTAFPVLNASLPELALPSTVSKLLFFIFLVPAPRLRRLRRVVKQRTNVSRKTIMDDSRDARDCRCRCCVCRWGRC